MSLKSSGLKCNLQTFECTVGFHRVRSGPIAVAAEVEGVVVAVAVEEEGVAVAVEVDEVAGRLSERFTAIRHFRFNSGSFGKLNPPCAEQPLTTHLFTMM